MNRRARDVFLQRRAYRRRRMMDAARLLPILGVILFLVPLLWMRGPDAPITTARALIYVFAIWAILIGASAALSRIIARPAPDEPETEE